MKPHQHIDHVTHKQRHLFILLTLLIDFDLLAFTVRIMTLNMTVNAIIINGLLF